MEKEVLKLRAAIKNSSWSEEKLKLSTRLDSLEKLYSIMYGSHVVIAHEIQAVKSA
jgi:hypothetical protein